MFLQTTPELGSWKNELTMHYLHEQMESGRNQTITFEQEHLIFDILALHARFRISGITPQWVEKYQVTSPYLCVDKISIQ